MRSRASFLLSLGFLIVACASLAQATEQPDVMVHGGGRTTGPSPINPVWIANIVNDPKDPAGPGTQILYREKIGDTSWQEFSRIAFRAAEITSESSELVIVKDNRLSWAWFSGSGTGMRFSYGPELPDHQKILAIAGDRKALWAIGMPTAGSTQPATQNTNPTTKATTRPSGPLLYLFTTDGWMAQEAPWPAGISFNDPDQVSMTTVNENPTLAINKGDRFVSLIQFSKTTKQWEKLKEGPKETSQNPVQWFKVLNLADQPAVWVWSDVEGSLGEIWTPSRVMPLPAIPGIGLGDADVTVAGDQIWLVYRTSQGKLFQQRFNLDGSRADDKPTDVNYTKAGNGNGRGDWMTIGAMTLLTLLILMALLRRRAAAQKDDGEDNGDET